jgi:AcrR family transcriptional regulator
MDMPKGIRLTEEELEQRRHEIAASAVPLFLAKGFQETGLREIARAAGIGKSTLYDYFPTKDDIIIFVIEENLTDLIVRANAIIAQEKSAPERLRQVMHMHLDFLLENKALFLRLSLEAQRLKAESQQRIQIQRYAYQDLLQDLIEAGIAEGSFRPVNPTMAMKALISMMTPVAFTSRPAGTPAEMLEDALDLVIHGLKA